MLICFRTLLLLPVVKYINSCILKMLKRLLILLQISIILRIPGLKANSLFHQKIKDITT